MGTGKELEERTGDYLDFLNNFIGNEKGIEHLLVYLYKGIRLLSISY